MKPSDSLQPLDAHNQALLQQVHPPDWQNPRPRPVYDLVVIGGGTAGLVTAAGASGLGAHVALIERHLLGGDCLNVGCVPSKTLLRSAHAAAELRRAGDFGLRPSASVAVDFPAVMERVRRLRAGISPHDSARRFTELGVDVFLGQARFVDSSAVEVEGARLRFAKAVIATGARPILPAIPGLAQVRPLTNETVFNLTELPPRLAVVGGGPIGCELAQAFQRLGSQVALLQSKDRLLPRDDPEAAAILEASLRRDGVELILNAQLERVVSENAAQVLSYQANGRSGRTAVDTILVAAGRAPNIEELNLAAAGVEADARSGVRVDDFLRSSNSRVFACGDVCLVNKFTHAADFTARLVIQNTLFSFGPIGRRRLSQLTIPWCTYTDPEVAQVGLAEPQARAAGLAVDVFSQPFARVDRAVTDGDTDGFVKMVTSKGSGTILGATVVGRHAGDLISEISVAMAGRVPLGRLAQVIHPYPTQAEAIRQCGDLYNRTRLTPAVKKWLERWLRWRRPAGAR
jgi:pyruvate/2-oxoglutarate dehydrogenase complex dihydrolipoamide dehydrogenase (E3) component